MNHHERRVEAAQLRTKPYQDHLFKIRGLMRAQGEDAIRRMWARGAATREKTLIRKGLHTPSVTRRVMKYLSSISRLQRSKAARRAKFEARNATK